MPGEPTRVRISFTVDLDEVPERISSLLKESSVKLVSQGGALDRAALNLIEKGNIKEASDLVEAARMHLMGVDLRLEDCQSLLASYQGAQVELATSRRDTGQEEQEIVLEKE